MVKTIGRESEKQQDTQIPQTAKGCWTVSKLPAWTALDQLLSLNCCCQWRAGKWPGLIQISSTSFLFFSPNPFFFPFLSSLALDHWCKNFKQHQPWCNSTWFTGSWRLFFASHHAEWQMLWRSCSCPDKFQVKIKVTEATSCRNKSWGRKNLEPPLEFK